LSHFAYLPIEIASSFISESLAGSAYEETQDLQEWPEEEVKTIRLALQKLSALRIINTNDAEDIVQDTLLTMVIKRPHIRLQKGYLLWSMGILRNKVGNYYRKNQRRMSHEHPVDPLQQQFPEEFLSPSPEGTMVLAELQEIVQDTLSQLPDPQRQVMELLLTGLDPGEIVRRLSPERYKSIITRIHRGRKKLAQELAKYGYGPVNKTGMHKMKRCRILK
jgi:RNA polymerase sigma-70 factor, ECF subfamily